METFHLNEGDLLNNRFRADNLLAITEHTKLYLVSDTEYGRQQCVLKVQLRDIFVDNYFNELAFLEVSKGIPGFPYLFDVFSIKQNALDFDCIVMSTEGTQLYKHIKSRAYKFTMANSLRIGFKLFKLLERMHSLGYTHGDCHFQNVLVDMSFGDVELSLIDFGYTAKLNAPHHGMNMIAWHESLNVCGGGDYTIIDDFVSMVFLIMITQSINPFGRERDHYYQRKLNFHRQPMAFFPDEKTKWIGDLYVELERQRTDGYNRARILQIFARAVPGVNPDSKIEFSNLPDDQILIN